MKELFYDAVIIGAGAAGMAAALEVDRKGFKTALIDREDHPGGILMQCIHNGFGLHEFQEDLTGPEFAERFIERVNASNIDVYLGTTVRSFSKCSVPAGFVPVEHSVSHVWKEIYCVSTLGVMHIFTKAVILAMGCRERNRGNVRIPGSRPAGIYTAGLAQRLVNIEGYIPGKEIVIIGSGDIGLIMARRMSWVGCKVKAMVEIMPYPSGLTRNIVQCLNDFNIPLYLSSQITEIYGNDRVEGVEVTPIKNGLLDLEKKFRIDCDTVLLSVGLIPENELSREAGVKLNTTTGGPEVDSSLMTNVEGVFACGNVLHVHDLVDGAVEEAKKAGKLAVDWLLGIKPEVQIRIKAGINIRYVNPGMLCPQKENKIYARSMIKKNNAILEVKLENKIIKTVKLNHVQPSEMITFIINENELKKHDFVEISLK